MKKSDHLPMYGVGPVYMYGILALLIAGIAAHLHGWLDSGIIPALRVPFLIAGVLLIVSGVLVWVAAVFGAKIDKGIKGNHLVTHSIYAWVRNPIYFAGITVGTGISLCFNNLWLLLLVPVDWIFLTLLMRATEEKWLLNLYGEEYAAYCRRVNRCFPWFPKK